MSRAPRGIVTREAGPTMTMRSPRITTTGWSIVVPSPTMRRWARMAIAAGGGVGVCAAMAVAAREAAREVVREAAREAVKEAARLLALAQRENSDRDISLEG